MRNTFRFDGRISCSSTPERDLRNCDSFHPQCPEGDNECQHAGGGVSHAGSHFHGGKTESRKKEGNGGIFFPAIETDPCRNGCHFLKNAAAGNPPQPRKLQDACSGMSGFMRRSMDEIKRRHRPGFPSADHTAELPQKKTGDQEINPAESLSEKETQALVPAWRMSADHHLSPIGEVKGGTVIVVPENINNGALKRAQ